MSSYLYYNTKFYTFNEVDKLVKQKETELDDALLGWKTNGGYVYSDYNPKIKANTFTDEEKEKAIQGIRRMKNDLEFLKAKVIKTFTIAQKKK